MIEPQDILFVGRGASSTTWYRCALPAQHIGADWVGVAGRPPHLTLLTGTVRDGTHLPTFSDYKVVIVQYPRGREWLRKITELREQGITVLYEIDDYLHGVAKLPYHDHAQEFSRTHLAEYELCMRACDGLICSTEYLARRYAKFNRTVYVCRNGIDIDRYQLTVPERDVIHVGWAGASGHLEALLPWVNALIPLMREHQGVRFVSIGEPGVAQQVGEMLGRRRALGIPFAPMEAYPAAMCHFDIALAPATERAWYRAKSDLRWLEASVLGIPTIADPRVYHEITPGVTGLWADSPDQAAECIRDLIGDADLRARVGDAAREYVIRERSSDVAAAAWMEVCSAAAGKYESLSQLRRA